MPIHAAEYARAPAVTLANLRRHPIALPTGGTAWAVDSSPDCPGEALVAALGLAAPRPTVVLNGTAAELAPELAPPVAAVLGTDGLAGLAASAGLALVTGGTDAGIFAVLGRAVGDRSADRSAVPLVGVAPRGLVSGPGAVALEPHHSHFVLVDGDAWGDETPALLALTSALSGTARSVVVVCGGGPVTRAEVAGHVRAGRPVVVLAGSGRFADELAGAHDGPHVTVCPLSAGPAALVEAVLAVL